MENKFSQLYQTDFNLWIEKTISYLKVEDFNRQYFQRIVLFLKNKS